MYKVVVKQENTFFISEKVEGDDVAAIKEIAEEMLRDLQHDIEIKKCAPCELGEDCPFDYFRSCF